MSYQTIKAVLEHRPPGVVPWREMFMDIDARDKFLPGLKDLPPREAKLRETEFFDNARMLALPFTFRTREVERGENYVVVENEIGTRTRTQFNPHFKKRTRYPVMRKSDLASLRLPDVDRCQCWRKIEDDIAFYSRRDYYVEGMLAPGAFFTGVWYNLRPITEFLADMAGDRPFAHELVDRMGEFKLRVAEQFLKRGVHALAIAEDMGCTNHPWFSPDMYEEYFAPWHRRLAELCHQYGAYLRVHSYGNIMAFADRLIATGMDILDPVGPGDNMDLVGLKARYGTRMVFHGGLSKFVARMTREEMEGHIAEVMEVGTRGGGFIARSEGGVPADLSADDLDFYIRTVRKYREKYGDRGSATASKETPQA